MMEENILERTLGRSGDGQRKFSAENFRGESENVFFQTRKIYFYLQATSKQNPAEWRGRNYFHLKRVMAKLQHMCLCECDHPLQIKII